jgi:hypothetical protein
MYKYFWRNYPSASVRFNSPGCICDDLLLSSTPGRERSSCLSYPIPILNRHPHTRTVRTVVPIEPARRPGRDRPGQHRTTAGTPSIIPVFCSPHPIPILDSIPPTTSTTPLQRSPYRYSVPLLLHTTYIHYMGTVRPRRLLGVHPSIHPPTHTLSNVHAHIPASWCRCWCI